MSYYDIIIFFLSIFYAFYMTVFIRTNVENSVNEANRQYAAYAASSCVDAFEQNVPVNLFRKGLISEKQRVFKDASVREGVVDTFYTSYGLNLNHMGKSFYDYREITTPALFLVDRDGFYACYNAGHDFDQSVTSPDSEVMHGITSLMPYAEKKGSYTVRYFLSDYVEVIKPDGSMLRGDRREVATLSGDASLSYLMDNDLFLEERTECVVNRLEEQFAYYANNNNTSVDMYNVHYSVNFSRAQGDTWCGLIDEPTVMAFIQADDYVILGSSLSVYGQANSSLIKPVHYFIHSDGYYYCYEDLLGSGRIDTSYPMYYQGQEIKKFYYSPESCAREGAYKGH